MVLNTATIGDIDEKLSEYNSRMINSRLRASRIAKRIVRKALEEVGEEVFTGYQVRGLAYLLGFYDPSFDDMSSCAPGITYNTFRRKIKPHIPQEAIVPNKYPKRNNREYNILFKRTGVEQTFQKLATMGELDYTPERFQYAVSKLP